MTSNKVDKNQSIAIKNGKIIAINDSKTSKIKAEKSIDLKGKFIMPSLSDAHVHLPEREDQLEKVLKLNLINGVTKLRSMRGDWNHLQWKAKYNNKESINPKLYLSPPPIHRGLESSKKQFENFVKSAAENNIKFIKVLSIKNQKTFEELDSICKSHNISIGGHFPSNPKGVLIPDEIIFFSNYRSFEHLGGLIGDSSLTNQRLQKIKEKNIFLCPTLQWYMMSYEQYPLDYMQKQRGMQFINAEESKDWSEKTELYRTKMGKEAFEEEVKKYRNEIEERLSVVKKANAMGIPLLLSPDSSTKFIIPGFGVLEEMKLYKRAGLSNFEILKAATVNFSKLFNENNGTLEVGKDADFLILNNNPLEKIESLESIESIFFNDQYINKEMLDQISASLLTTK
ncbi:amidohydrolase family protein [Flavobacterium sp. SM15]|uniref:amidohydrolase family protein n=1 Tax=Flavobacterium sp. SM15 TaxID=2908005 RepID=UPI001EDA6EAB|nr:amidohydrolase family protein [Flavobacterium sp. SM15]MCG2610563.1 amidohydrolase family protein [Flavobacterium sp. SM15]